MIGLSNIIFLTKSLSSVSKQVWFEFAKDKRVNKHEKIYETYVYQITKP